MSVRRASCAVVTLCVLGWASAVAAAPEGKVALHSYVKAGEKSTHYFALSLTPEIAAPEKQACDVVVLIDTSASQVSRFREQALATLDKLVAGLDKGDRLHLIALDIDAKPLTKSFVAADSSEWKKALAELQKRVPLGSTDMVAGLTAASAAFDDKAILGAKHNPQRAVMYIGDGMASGNVSASQSFRAAIRKLVQLQAPVNSIAVGPQRDDVLLLALANQTGGMVAIIGANYTAEQAGGFLAAAAHGAVIWTDALTLPESAKAYPQPMIPVRLDRDTIVIGSGGLETGAKIQVTGTLAGKPVEVTWQVPGTAPNVDNAYLETLVESARRDKGQSLATLSTRGLELARSMAYRNSEALAGMTRQAIASGDTKNARTLLDQLKRLDPNHPQAAALEKALNPPVAAPVKESVKDSAKNSTKSSTSAALSPFMFVAQQDADAPPARAEASDDALTRGAVEDRRRHEARVVKEVEVLINDARRSASSSPHNVLRELKEREVFLDRDPVLSPEVRSQLQDKMASAIKEAQRWVEVKDQVRAVDNEKVAAARERERILQGLLSDQERLRQLMAQFRSLMEEGYYAKAELDVAPEVKKYEPGDPDEALSTSATMAARRIGAFRQSSAIRDQINKNLVQALLAIDESGIPFDDRNPIIYRDAKEWEELTNRRKEFSSVDLKKRGGAEDKIFKSLGDVTELNIIEGETGLPELAEMIQQKHGIMVQLDVPKLTEAGKMEIKFDKPLSGISLRSALRILLKAQELSYVVQNEVLVFTTEEQVKNTLTTKVYPVADLVLPIKPINFADAFGGLNFGGGSGQAGDSFGGQGGGGQGGGGGGAF